MTNWLFSVAVAACMTYLILSAPRADDFTGEIVTAPVSKIVDGDTFYLSGLKDRIRVWGIDAPEMKDRAGRKAKLALGRIVGRDPLRCQMKEKDRYGRHVALCTLPDGRDIAAEMIREGHAVEFKRYSKGYYRNISAGE